MPTVTVKETGNRRSVNAKIKNLIRYFKKEGALPFENKILGDHVANWAHATWAFQSWSGMTRDEIKAYSEELQYKRILASELKKSAGQVLRTLMFNPYAETIAQLLQQLIDEDKDSLFVFCLARELSRKEKGTLVHHGLLNAIVNKPDAYGTLEQIRSVPERPTEDLIQVWTEVDWLREQAIRPLPQKAEEVESIAYEQVIEPFHPRDNDWRNGPGSSRTLSATPTNELHARRFIRKMWLELEDRVSWEMLRLTQDARAATIPKNQLWERQNRIELAIRNVTMENPQHPDIPSYRQYVQYYRPLLRANMAFLISHYPRLAQMVCEVIEIMMIREVDAFAFIVTAANLSFLRDDDSPVRDILNDMMHPEPKIYTHPRDILRRLHEAEVYIPEHLSKPPTVTIAAKNGDGSNAGRLSVAHPRHRSKPA